MFQSLKKASSLFLVFLLFFVLIFTSKNFLAAHYIDIRVLLFANVFFLFMSLISFLLQLNGMKHNNPNVFVRSVMGSMMLKMMATIVAVAAYVLATGNQFNKRGIFVSLFLYLIFLSVEVFTIMKLNKKQNA